MTAKAMSRVAALAVGALAGLILAGCSSDKGATPPLSVLTRMTSQLAHREEPKPAHMSRAEIRDYGHPLLLAASPQNKVQAYLAIAATNGPVVTWISLDLRSISLKDGMVTQTRGLGEDLMSAALPSLAALRSGRGTVQATYYYLDGNDQTYAIPVSCTLSEKGRESVDIAEIRYVLRHVSASCQGETVSFTNDYWFDSRQKIRQSRQWISPSLGYFEFADLTE